MPADAFTYCLEEVTDYAAYERFCSDVMRQTGYLGIEPIGGTGDSGRDALHQTEAGTIFAYTVRKDWEQKLYSDCEKVIHHKYPATEFIFVCIATFSASKRDQLVNKVQTRYGLKLELWGIERLKAHADAEIITRHPSIFITPFYDRVGGQILQPIRNLIVILNTDQQPLANWLSNKLKLYGYHTWCEYLSPTGGKTADEVITELLKHRAQAVVDISDKSKYQQLIDAFDIKTLLVSSQSSNPCPNPLNWANVLQYVTSELSAIGVPTNPDQLTSLPYTANDTNSIAISNKPETLYSNWFEITHLPKAIHRFTFKQTLTKQDTADLNKLWAFRKSNLDECLAFHHPNESISSRYKIESAGALIWDKQKSIDGIKTTNLIKELLRKMLTVHAIKLGIAQTEEDQPKLFYPSDYARIKIHFEDKKSTTVSPHGIRTFPGNPKEQCLYSLSPSYKPLYIEDKWYIQTVINILFFDLNENLLTGRKNNSRRKKLGKTWWNKHWRNRHLAIIQSLAEDNDSELIISQGTNQLCIAMHPVKGEVNISLNENTEIELTESDQAALGYDTNNERE